MVSQRRIEPKMIKCVVRRIKRRGQIVIPFGDENMKKGVLRHGAAQRFGYVDVAILEWFIAPGVYASGQNLVRQITIKFQIASNVIVERGRVRSDNRGDAGIVLRRIARRIAVNARETPVDTANSTPLAAQQFLREALNLHAQIGPLDV